MNNKFKIALITVYMGNWPWYFKYFLHTCQYNGDIDFYIFTDITDEIKYPPNVIKIKYTLDQFNKEATELLGFNINVNYAYKLCDFKPAYGFLFEDIIKDYDFWGYCDIDIIWGNIRKFMTNEILSNYGIISGRHDYMSGGFALFKNTKFNRNLFKLSKDFKKVFTEQRNFLFDETNFAFEEFSNGTHYKEIKTEIESFTHVVLKLKEKQKIKVYFELQILEGITDCIKWDDGTLIYNNQYELLAFHLVRLKDSADNLTKIDAIFSHSA